METKYPITLLPNIGTVVAEKLSQVGINTPEELIAIGSEQAFTRLQTIDSTACFSMLQALEGAAQGIRWHKLTKERKAQLKAFYDLKRM